MSTGGPFWILPLVFLALPLLTLAQHGSDLEPIELYLVLVGLGVVSLIWVLVAKLQVVELHDEHFVHRKWWTSRIVPYDMVLRAYSELKSASRSYPASLVPRQGIAPWSTPRTLHVELASGEELELIEMSEHALLEQRLNQRARGATLQHVS